MVTKWLLQRLLLNTCTTRVGTRLYYNVTYTYKTLYVYVRIRYNNIGTFHKNPISCTLYEVVFVLYIYIQVYDGGMCAVYKRSLENLSKTFHPFRVGFFRSNIFLIDYAENVQNNNIV